MSAIIAPSILSANFGKLYEEIEMINNSEAGWFHVDVMDGVFVPNISFGFPVLEAIRKHTKKTLDVHIMIENPDDFLVG
jgi:ribulose-phosphate 3-epimerase